jgi:hypothetical protein
MIYFGKRNMKLIIFTNKKWSKMEGNEIENTTLPNIYFLYTIYFL